MVAHRGSDGKRKLKMKDRETLLVEIGTEELPPKALLRLSESFSDNLVDGLIEAGMVDSDEAAYTSYATPRRLAVKVMAVKAMQPDRSEQRRGPALTAAFDADGNPTPAALGFARSCGIDVTDLERQQTEKGEWLAYSKQVKGEELASVLNDCLDSSIAQLPIPKRMRWGIHDVEFVRPAHWLLVLHGTRIVPVNALGLTADSYSIGHRFHAGGKLKITSADRYDSILSEDGFVIAEFNKRQAVIRKQLEALADEADLCVVIDEDLLNEVTGLVEWPQSILGEFERRFLDLPEEVLKSSMRGHQKYFHLVDENGQLQPNFITVCNIESKSPTRVKEGNERVLRARLSDADFFWQSDRKRALHDRTPDLADVLFHKKLGTVFDKTKRLQQLGSMIADTFGVEKDLLERAAWLLKADLVTDMVGEFPELQGIMGRYYASHDGEQQRVAEAISQHYLPRFSGDELPHDSLAQCLAVTDRIDTLAGIFACGEIPTGDKDPYGLRRAALSVMRILIEEEIDLDLRQCIQLATDVYQKNSGDAPLLDEKGIEHLLQFMFDRLRAWYQAQDYRAEEITSVSSLKPGSPLDFHNRLVAVHEFFGSHGEAALSLAVANKRIANLLEKSDHTEDVEYDHNILSESAELELSRAIESIRTEVEDGFNSGSYKEAFDKLSRLRQPIDSFFDQVMVMTDDPAVRANRLALLAVIRRMFLGAADISYLRVDK